MNGICSSFDVLGDVYTLSLFALVITSLVITIVYLFGQFLRNPKLLAWSKTEFFQIGVSVVLAILVLQLIGVSCWLESSQLQEVLGAEKSSTGKGVFEISQNYLKDIADYNHRTIQSIRYYGGSAEILSRYGRQLCEPGIFICVFGPNGKNFSPFSGLSFVSQIMGVLLYSTTVSYLTVLAQLFFITALNKGALLQYLPLALILRSMPFFRKLGGALIAIVISLFIIFPFLLTMESFFWNPSTFGDPSKSVYDSEFDLDYSIFQSFGEQLGDIMKNIKDIVGKIFDIDGKDLLKEPADIFQKAIKIDEPNDVTDISTNYYEVFSYAASSFITSVFLFSFNILAIAASARALSRIIGEEVDLTRLIQII
ncbi:hypothetical protein KAW38_03410 [Candidatus Micrarchaeota archaeon]|nr:hypothetical protein [Candidatus Micrarchaeota archaeon]